MRVKKKKQTRRSLSFFKLHARAFPPYKVLVDGSFAAAVASKKLGAVEDVCARVLEAGVRIFVTSCVMRELRRLQAEQRRCGDGNGVVGDHAVDYAQLVSACSREHCLKCEYVTEEEVAAAVAAAAVAAEQTQKKEDEQVVHESDVGEDEDEDADADDVKDNGNAAATTDDEDEEGEEGEDEATREERRRERQRRRKREERRRRQLRAKQEYVTGAACILKRVEAAVAASYPEYNDKPSQTNENYAGVCRGGSADAARECLFVATQDARLKPLLRRLPGVPIITVTPSGRVILEPPSPKQLAMAEEGEAGRRKVADHEAGVLKQMKKKASADGGGEDEYEQYYNTSSARFKRNRAKGPNPLSSKKKMKKSSTGNTDDNGNGAADGAQPKKKRRRRKPATERHPQVD